MVIDAIIAVYFYFYHIFIQNIVCELLLLAKLPPEENITKSVLRELLSSPRHFIYIFFIILAMIFFLVLINETIIDAIVALIFTLAFSGIFLRFGHGKLSNHFLKKYLVKLEKVLVRYQKHGDIEKATLVAAMIDSFSTLAYLKKS
jgi:hypothetical protein